MSLGKWMESEIRAQPDVLASNCTRYLEELRAAVNGRTYDMVLLAARGSSDNAALYGRYLIEIHLGLPVSLAAPSVITRYRSEMRYPRCLAVGISQSGEAPDVSEVLAYMRASGHTTLAITNSSGSRMEREAEFTLQLGAGKEQSVAATKTYTASLLAMAQLVRALGASLPDPMPSLPNDSWVHRSASAAQESLGQVLRSHTLFALARGYSFCTAQESALKMMECALLPCKSYSVADFQHGPRALATYGSCAVVYGDEPNGLEGTGCLVVQAPIAESLEYAPIRDIVFGQMLALAASRARGLDPDRPQNLSKVTKTL